MYYGKVEICGINTAKLPVLKESEKNELLKLAKSGDKFAREKMINGNLRLVLSVVQKFTGRGEPPDDLFQVGCIGLIKAIDNFDPNLDVRFSTYGVPMIIGEIRRFLRDSNSVRVSRSMRDIAYRAMQVKENFINEHGREPKAEEIAQILKMPKSRVVIALEAVVEPISLYEPVYSESGDTIFMMDQISDKNSDSGWIEEISLKEALKILSPREKHILAMRFFDGKTQTDVASQIGISQAQVSRLEKGALQKIKKQL